MMYVNHAQFDTPQFTTKIWRYLDFTKLVAMLESNCLFFPSVATLEDKFEGAYTNIIYPLSANAIDPAEEIRFAQHVDKTFRNNARLFRPLMYVNCWHMNDHESPAMWKTYLKSNEGIAVASTVHSLTKCFTNAEPIYIGKVQYLDYKADVIKPDNFLRPLVCKRKSFEYEQEVRADYFDVAYYTSLLNSGMFDAAVDDWKPDATFERGMDIAIDVNTLVVDIYVAPTAEKWFHKLVEATLKTYGLERVVKQSSLAEDPVW